MFKIPFSGNSKVIDLLQVTNLPRLEDIRKHISKGIMSATNQTKQKMHCIEQVDGEKKSIFTNFKSLKSGFM